MKSVKSYDTAGDRFPGLDILRVLAMALITAQHGLAAIGKSSWVQFHGVDAGQLGVGLFCAVSGLLAMNDRRGPADWLWRRLKRLFPPYWLAMLFSFAVTALIGRKSFDGYQFISQMLGTGYFTHGWYLVNQVTWFISLILLCYALAFVAKLFSKPVWAMAIFSLVAAGNMLLGAEVDLSQHVLSFCVAGTAMCVPRKFRRAVFIGSAAVLWLLVFRTKHFAFPAVGMLLTGLLYTVPWGRNAFLSVAGGALYEYFLVHGIFFVGAGQFIRSPVLVVACGLAGSIIGAIMLRKATEIAGSGWRRAGRCLARPETGKKFQVKG